MAKCKCLTGVIKKVLTRKHIFISAPEGVMRIYCEGAGGDLHISRNKIYRIASRPPCQPDGTKSSKPDFNLNWECGKSSYLWATN